MAARAAVTQRPQYGVETDIGTAVAASKSLRTIGLKVEPDIKRETIVPAGRQFGTGVYTKSEASKGSLDGQVCARELTDVLALVFGDAYSTSQPYSGVVSRSFHVVEDANAWTVQAGDTTNAVEVAGLIATDADFVFEKNSGKAEIKVGLIGQIFDNEATLTASPVDLDNIILTGAGVSVYIASTLAGLDSSPTQLTSVIGAKVKFDKIRTVAWFLNAAKTSWSDVVADNASGSDVELTLEADSAGRAFLTYLRDNTTKYIRIVVTGETIASTYEYELTFDFAVTPKDYNEKEEDGVYAVTVPLAIIEDVDNFSHKVTLVNDQALLTALTPTFGSATSTAGGYTFGITNYDADYTWAATVPGGTATIGSISGSDATVTVTGLGSAVTAITTVTTARTLYANGSATKSGTSLA